MGDSKVISVNNPPYFSYRPHGKSHNSYRIIKNQNYNNKSKQKKPKHEASNKLRKKPNKPNTHLKEDTVAMVENYFKQNKIKKDGKNKKIKEYFTTIINDLFNEAGKTKPNKNSKKSTSIDNEIPKVYNDDIFADSKPHRIPKMPPTYAAKDIYDQIELFDDFKKGDKSRKKFVSTSLVDQNKEIWIREQLNRKKKAKESCSNLHMKTDLDGLLLDRKKLSNLLVDDEHGVIYCYIPKVNNY